MVRSYLAIGATALTLGGCAFLANLPGALSGNSVPTAQVRTAIDAYSIAEVSAQKYIDYCTPKVEPIGCSDVAVETLISAIRAGNIAKKQMLVFMAANPGALGPANYYNAIVGAETTINQVAAQYNIKE